MIFDQLKEQLNNLIKLLKLINANEYTLSITHLGNASIGSHTRHIIELLQCVTKAYDNGFIDYINRVREFDLEKNKCYALNKLNDLINNIEVEDKALLLLTEAENNKQLYNVSTTYYREIVYNTEHIIHHLALIKVALVEMNLNIVEESFGMAYSTIKYKTLSVS